MSKFNKQRKLVSKKKNQGIALVELLIVIGIIGLITAGIVALSTTVFNGLDEQDVLSKVNEIKGKVQKGYKSQGDYAGLTSSTPVIRDTDIQNPFGADLFLNPVALNGKADAGALLAIPSLNEEACINILTVIDKTAFEYVSVNAGGAGAAPAIISGDLTAGGLVSGNDFVIGGVETSTPLTVTNIAAECTTGAANANAMIYLGFY